MYRNRAFIATHFEWVNVVIQSHGLLGTFSPPFGGANISESTQHKHTFLRFTAHFHEVHTFLMQQKEVYRLTVDGQHFYPPGMRAAPATPIPHFCFTRYWLNHDRDRFGAANWTSTGAKKENQAHVRLCVMHPFIFDRIFLDSYAGVKISCLLASPPMNDLVHRKLLPRCSRTCMYVDRASLLACILNAICILETTQFVRMVLFAVYTSILYMRDI